MFAAHLQEIPETGVIGRTSEVVTAQIKDASDIVDVVGSYVTLTRAGRDFKGLCPFHNEKTASFNVIPGKQIFYCFGCNAGGDVFKFLQMREGVDFLEARAILAARAGIDLEQREPATRGSGDIGKRELERANRWALQWFQRQFTASGSDNVREYMSRRGVSATSVQEFEIGFAPDGWNGLLAAADRQNIPRPLLMAAGLIKAKDNDEGRPYDAFRNRLMFPIKDALGRPIGFGGRTLGDDTIKYINSPQSALFDKSRCLYGLPTARDAFASTRTAIVVEGYFDCIAAQQNGFRNTVATLGTALTPEHVQLLRRYVDSVILVFDADQAGRNAADRALEVFLTGRLNVRLAVVPDGKDPAEFFLTGDKAGFEQALTSSVPALEFKWNQVAERFRSHSAGQEQRRAIEEFLELVARAMRAGDVDPIQWGLISNQVGRLLGLPTEDVHRHMRQRAARERNAPRREASPPVSQSPEIRGAPDAASAAMLELLEVLLNEPSYYDSLAGRFDPQALTDEAARAIATEFVRTAEQGRPFGAAELMARFESIDVARRMTELQLRGEQRGNYGERIEGAVLRLQQRSQFAGRRHLAVRGLPSARGPAPTRELARNPNVAIQ